MSLIHPTAIIGDEVTLGENVSVGAYSVVEGKTTLGDDTVLHSHVAIAGETEIGIGCEIFHLLLLAINLKIRNTQANAAGWSSAIDAPSAKMRP